MQKISFKNKEI